MKSRSTDCFVPVLYMSVLIKNEDDVTIGILHDCTARYLPICLTDTTDTLQSTWYVWHASFQMNMTGYGSGSIPLNITFFQSSPSLTDLLLDRYSLNECQKRTTTLLELERMQLRKKSKKFFANFRWKLIPI